ncbi:MAG: DUF4369 domain-containing protein [Bacteroidia bacterium]|nr:DUF4369 domain-containing protein [Bacteroidia bacterium]
MKPRYYGLLILSIVLIISTGYINKTGTDKKGKGHEIKITIQHVKDSLCYLYHHFGDKQRAVDTVPLDASGRCVFTGDEPLSGGIYIVYIPNKVYFEIMVNEQFFSLETDTGDFIGKMKITGSVENKIFNDYQKYRKVQYNKSQALKKRLDNNKNNPDSTKIIEDLMKKVGTETEKYTLDLIENNKDAFFVKVLKMTKPIDIPGPPKDANGNIIDSNFALQRMLTAISLIQILL